MKCSPFGKHNTKPIPDVVLKKGFRLCWTCRVQKPEKQFTKSKSGLRPYCRPCDASRRAGAYRDSKKVAVEYLGGKCVLCGYSKYIGALHFHHRDPSEKEFGFGVNRKVRWCASVKKELDKCVLLCANCHGEVHAGVSELPADVVFNR